MSSIGILDTVPTRPVRSVRLSHAPHRVLDLAANVAVLGALWLAYAAVRGVTADDMVTALGNAERVLDVQRSLHLPGEAWLQQQVLPWTWLVRAANRFYLYVHFPVTALFLGGTWLRHRRLYSRVRDSLVLVTGTALVLHVAMPLAPPRMMPGFVDTGAVHGPSPYDLAAASAANQIAAMPSLHVGWALLLAIAVVAGTGGRWRWLAVAHPILTTVVVVVTANHYWADCIVAASLVTAAWWATGRVRRDPAAAPSPLAEPPVLDLRSAPPVPASGPHHPRTAIVGGSTGGRRRGSCRSRRPTPPPGVRPGPRPLAPPGLGGRSPQRAGRAGPPPGRPSREERRHDRPDPRDGFDR